MAKANNNAYVGGELDLFALAVNWKRYLKAEIENYLIGDVLEVGAGIGGTTTALHDGHARRWFCLEPDYQQARRLRATTTERAGTPVPRVVVGSLEALAQRASFDCVLYIDVLEHILDDKGEVEAAGRLVRVGGHIVVLSPAHRWLFSEFDRKIGHLRRYNRLQLRSLMPKGWVEKKLNYLDSFGVLLSLGNVVVLRKAMPSPFQITLWDRVFVPCSRIADRLLQGNFGKSVLAVWRKESSA